VIEIRRTPFRRKGFMLGRGREEASAHAVA